MPYKILNNLVVLIKKNQPFLWGAGLLYLAYVLATSIVKEQYFIVGVILLLAVWVVVFLNPKKAFYFLMLTVPFGFFIKMMLKAHMSGLFVTALGAYKDILIFFILSSMAAALVIKNRYSFRISALNLSIWFFILLIIAMFVSGADRYLAGLIGLRRTIIYIAMFFMAQTFLKDKADIRKLINYMMLIAFILAVGAAYQWFFLPETASRYSAVGGGYAFTISRAVSFFQGPNVLGFYLAFFGAFLIGIIFTAKTKSYWNLFVPSAVLCCILVGLFLSLSRGAWIALVAGFLVWGAIKFRYLMRRFMLLGIIFIIAVIFILNIPLIYFRIQSLFDLTDKSRTSRFATIFVKWAIKADNPKYFLFGNGLGTTGAVPEALETEGLKSGFLDFYYLELYHDIGIVGLGSFLLIIFLYLRLIYLKEKKTKDPYYKSIFNGLMLSTLVFIFSGFFTGVGASFEEASLFWAFMGMAIVIKRIDRDTSIKESLNENIAFNKRLPS